MRRRGLWVAAVVVTVFSVSGCPQAGSGGGDNRGGNSPPQADAGPDQGVTLGDTVSLDGSGSSDSESESLTAVWAFQSVPGGSSLDNLDISGVTSLVAEFIPDVAGTYEVSLTVADPQGASSSDNALIEVSPDSDSSNDGDDQGGSDDPSDPVDPPAEDPINDVNIEVIFADPADPSIGLSGATTLNRAAGEAANITVSPAAFDAYLWYLDGSTTYPGGEPLGTGSSIELNSVLITSWLGPHSLTVVAIQNGLAYSATVTIDIVDGPVEE